jgi:hypothetical protein
VKTWDDFMPAMVGKLPGCPTFVIRDELRDAAIDFLRRSRAWKVEQVSLGSTVSGTRVLWITDNPEDAGLTHLHAVWIGGEEARVLLPGESEDAAPGKLADRPGVLLGSRSSLVLSPAPRVGGQAIVATVSYEPTEVARGVSDALYRDYHLAIERRACAELMVEPGRPWSNPALGAAYMTHYESLLSEAANEAGPVRRTPLRVRPWG